MVVLILPESLIIVLIVVLLAVLLREVTCWYWKVNKMVELLQSIDNRLSKIENSQKANNNNQFNNSYNKDI